MTVPHDNAAFRGGELVTWYANEGDALSFGAALCDISIDDFMALQRTKRASLLGSTSRLRQRKISDGTYRREGRGSVVIRLTCAESNMVLKQKMVNEGERVTIGSAVGLIGTPDAELGVGLPVTEARIAVDYPDPEEFDPFD
ncbi:MAG: hypothetical protein WEB67_05635 [Acidimicrobiia bacterium]